MREELDEAPLFGHAQRELHWILAAWLISGLWVVGVSWWAGTGVEEEEIQLVLGLPSWVFWGVALPWVAATLFTFWFCFRCMAEDSLQSPEEEAPPAAPCGEELDP